MPRIGPFDWDEAKRDANLARPGIDFAAVVRFDWDNAQLVPDTRRDYGELRIIAASDRTCMSWFLRHARN